MKTILYAFIFILHCLNFSTITAQEEDYESISLTAYDHAELTSLNQQFIQAVKNNDLNRTNQLISQGADINHQDELGNTAGHYAWSADTNWSGPYDKIKATLITAKANFDIPNLENKTTNDFICEIEIPFINMNSHEIIDSLESMIIKSEIYLIQPKIQAEANANEEFANFIINRKFTHTQFTELIKALNDNKLTEYMQKYTNQS